MLEAAEKPKKNRRSNSVMVLDKIEPVVTEKSAVLKTQHGRWTHDCTTEIIYRQIP